MISHNHYDHQDNITLAELYEHYYARPPLLFIPLNNTHNLPSSIPRDRIIEMDWWEERDVQVQGKGNIKITCSTCRFLRNSTACSASANRLCGSIAEVTI